MPGLFSNREMAWFILAQHYLIAIKFATKMSISLGWGVEHVHSIAQIISFTYTNNIYFLIFHF